MDFSLLRQENQEIDPSLSLSTSSSHNWTYDVFPSFRGEDVRKDFLSHIQKEFGRKGITPFIDNEIKRGESIGPELVRAIKESKIALILLSKNYASSKWCLDELVEIIKCREEVGQTVMAIFYKVDPSHVKKLTGEFGKVFEKTCEGKRKEDIEKWREAFVKVATIAGYDSSNWDYEAAMIEKIATDVSNELIHSVPSSDFDGLVGMRAHMENMNLFLRLDSNEVKMIGIWGPSGIGKSTIARVLYSKYSSQFQLSVFMDNIKRRYPNIHGCDEYSAKLLLQKEFLSQIINHEGIKIHHLGIVQDRLKDKRVLVVLDDVDHSMQVEAMAKEVGWFGPGSRIIITTQDKNLLNAPVISHIYQVGFPHDIEALEIFCINAFGQKSPYKGFEELAWEVTELAGKLPLGLRIMGSYLKGRTKQEWKRELPRLKTSLGGEIESILKFSYDALSAEDKELFLYIACMFNYQEIERVEAHLANHFSNVSQGLYILAEKSLISFNNHRKYLLAQRCRILADESLISDLRFRDGSRYIEMHDLLVCLGRDIVRKQSSQIVVDVRDICKVLKNNTASGGSVICAVIDFPEINKELNKCDNAVESMSCLQFLRVNDKSVPEKVLDWQYFRMTYLPSIFNPYRNTTQILRNLPRKVRLLDWEYFPMSSLPSDFNPEFLVELKMHFNKLEKMWGRKKTIRNLKWMDLSYSRNLRKLPDLSTATNLLELELTFCTDLAKLPSSIGNAINLKILNLSSCLSLRKLPSSIGNAINLKELNLSSCSNLRELPSSIGNVTSLRKLVIKGCRKLLSLPQLPDSLEILDAQFCESLEKLHCSFNNSRFVELNFGSCSKLNQEARDLIIIIKTKMQGST